MAFKTNIVAEIHELAEKKKEILFINSYSSSQEKDNDLSELECSIQILATKLCIETGLDHRKALREAIDSEVDKEILKRKEAIESLMKEIVVLEDDVDVCSTCLQDTDCCECNAAVLELLHTLYEKCVSVSEGLKKKPDSPLRRHDMYEDRQQNVKRKRVSHGDEELNGETRYSMPTENIGDLRF